mgnify:CR=1 FL=1
MTTLDEQLKSTQKKVNALIDQILSAEGRPKVLYKASRHLIEAGGKRLRPFVALKACELVGGNEEDALPAATAVELLHSFTLVHDDVMDRSKMRRGVPTVHVLYGIPMAVNAGDLIFARVYDAILDHTNRTHVSSERILRVLSIITQATISVCEGQARDISFEKRKRVTEAEYFEMVRWKTAALYEAAAKVGAIVGGGTEDQISSLGNFAHNAGVAFQIRDDILGLIGDEAVLKKPVGDDIRQGKQTILVTYALKHANQMQRKKILVALSNPKATAKQIQEAIDVIQSLGAVAYANKKAEEFTENAKTQLSSFPDSPAKTALLELAELFITRKY